MKALTRTDFNFPGQKSVYHGKVRDVYNIDDDILVMVASDRISAFDVILPKGIPFKGQVLNQIAARMLDATKDICPNWKLATPDPQVTVGLACEGFRVEMIIRGILCFKELMVEINIVGFHLLQLTGGNQGVYK